MAKEEITLAQVMESAFQGCPVDKSLLDRVYKFQINYISKNPEHLAFFGSNLLGVHSLRFKTSDTLHFFSSVLKLEYAHVERLVRTCTTIDHEFKIAGDIFNLCVMYIIHRVLNEPKLSLSQRERGIYDIALVYMYRCFAIRIGEYFPHPTDPKIAQYAFARLSNRFMIKKLGNWRKVCEYRAKHFLEEDKDEKIISHRDTLAHFKDDDLVIYAISNTVNAVKEQIKAYSRVFYQVHEEGQSVTTTGGTQIDLEGHESLREKTKSVDQYVNLLRNMMGQRDTLIRPELINVILDICKNASSRVVTTTLSWMSDKTTDSQWNAKIDEHNTKILSQSFFYLQRAHWEKFKDYSALLLYLKNMYGAAIVNDPDLTRIRELSDTFIKKSNGNINKSLAVATRTAIALYLTLRVLTSQ